MGWTSLAFLAGILGFFVVWFQADNFKWKSDDKLTYMLLAMASAAVACTSVLYLVNWFRDDFKPRALINPLYFMRFRFGRIEAIPLTSAEVWDVRHLKDSHGVYSGSKFYFRSETGKQLILKTNSIRIANDLVAALNRSPSYVDSLFQSRDNTTLYSFDLIYEWRLREKQFPRASPDAPRGLAFLSRKLGPAIVSASVGAALFFTAVVPYNDYRDDELRWAVAISASSANSYRLYLAARPYARHESQARAAIAVLYDRAVENYRSSSGFATSDGAEAVIRILEYAKNTDRYQVFVTFSGDNEIPPNIEQRIRLTMRLPQIVPIMPSFTPSMNQAREARILQRISNSFGRVIPGDILQFSVGNGSPQNVRFSVAYIVRASGGMYYPEKQEHLAVAGRDWYTGIEFDWRFFIFVPGGEASKFQLALKSEPAQLFNVAYTRTASEGTSLAPMEVYGSMADSAFDNFGSKLLSELSVR